LKDFKKPKTYSAFNKFLAHILWMSLHPEFDSLKLHEVMELFKANGVAVPDVISENQVKTFAKVHREQGQVLACLYLMQEFMLPIPYPGDVPEPPC
jgi:hypothetical protein